MNNTTEVANTTISKSTTVTTTYISTTVTTSNSLIETQEFIIGVSVAAPVMCIIVIVIICLIRRRHSRRKKLPPPLPPPHQIPNCRTQEPSVSPDLRPSDRNHSQIESTTSRTDSMQYLKPVQWTTTDPIIHSTEDNRVSYILMSGLNEEPSNSLPTQEGSAFKKPLDRKTPPVACKPLVGYVNVPNEKHFPALKITSDESGNMIPKPVFQKNQYNKASIEYPENELENSGEEYENVAEIILVNSTVDTYGSFTQARSKLESPVSGASTNESECSSPSTQNSDGNYQNVPSSMPDNDAYQTASTDVSLLSSSNDSLYYVNNEYPSSYVNVDEYPKIDLKTHVKEEDSIKATSTNPAGLKNSSKPKTQYGPKPPAVFPKPKNQHEVLPRKTSSSGISTSSSFTDLDKDGVKNVIKGIKVSGNSNPNKCIIIENINNEGTTVSSSVDECSTSSPRKMFGSEPMSSKNLQTIQQAKITETRDEVKFGAEAVSCTNVNTTSFSKPSLSNQYAENIKRNKSLSNTNENGMPQGATRKQSFNETSEKTQRELSQIPQYQTGMSPRFPLQNFKFASTPNVSNSANEIKEMRSKLKKVS